MVFKFGAAHCGSSIQFDSAAAGRLPASDSGEHVSPVNAQGTGTGSPACCQGQVEGGQAKRRGAQRAEPGAVVFKEAGCGVGWAWQAHCVIWTGDRVEGLSFQQG